MKNVFVFLLTTVFLVFVVQSKVYSMPEGTLTTFSHLLPKKVQHLNKHVVKTGHHKSRYRNQTSETSEEVPHFSEQYSIASVVALVLVLTHLLDLVYRQRQKFRFPEPPFSHLGVKRFILIRSIRI